jgi:hypothetical protein
LLLSPIAQAVDASREDKIKAAYVYSLSKYVTWPELGNGSDMQVCILGDPAMFAAAATIEGKQVHGRSIQTRVITSSDVKGCKIVFFGGSDSRKITQALQELKGTQVLTMADTSGFADEGGIIRLFVVNNTIKFEINASAASANGLEVNDRLLALANRVIQ